MEQHLMTGADFIVPDIFTFLLGLIGWWLKGGLADLKSTLGQIKVTVDGIKDAAAADRLAASEKYATREEVNKLGDKMDNIGERVTRLESVKFSRGVPAASEAQKA